MNRDKRIFERTRVALKRGIEDADWITANFSDPIVQRYATKAGYSSLEAVKAERAKMAQELSQAGMRMSEGETREI